MASLGKKILVYSLCSMLASPFMVLPKQSYAQPAANLTVFSGGTIYTMTESLEEVQQNVAPHRAMVVVVNNDTGKIEKVFKDGEDVSAYVGNKNYKQVDLGNNVMLPGFIDPHGHFPSALAILSIDLSPTPILEDGIDTLADLQNTLLQAAKDRNYDNSAPRVNWIQGFGYDDTMLDIKQHPSHEQLSEGDLGRYFVTITHISGHMAVSNTKALERLFDQTYIQGTFNTFLQGKKLIPEGRSAKSAKLINTATGIQYQLTLDDGSTTTLAGIQMRPADENFKDNMTPQESVKYMTGLLLETASSYTSPDYAQGDMVYIPKTAENIPYAAKEYISRGVTSANHGGSTTMDTTVNQAQQALIEGKLPLRMVIQPRIYLNSGTDITEATLRQHYALGWENMIVTGDSSDRTIGKPGADSPQTGDDITSWFAGDTAKGAASSTNMGKPGDQADPSSYAYQLSQLKDNPKYQDRLMLGTWKYNYDGSIQGYTGYLAEHGYYKLPEGQEAFNPAGRVSDADGNNAVYKMGGTVSVNDPKFFCGAGEHYGNENSLGTGTYDSMQKAVEQYHAANQGVSFHLNGSWANDDVVNFIEQAVAKHPEIKDRRHTVIHAQMQDLQHIQRFMGNYDQFPIDTPANIKKYTSIWAGVNALTWQKAAKQDDTYIHDMYNPEEGEYLDEFAKGTGNTGEDLRKALGTGEQSLMRAQNIISSYFVDHTYYWGERHRDIFMGKGRAYNMSPMGWAVQLGHRYTFHNDTPVTPQNPLKSISIATTRLSSGQQPGGVKEAPEPIYGTAGVKDIKATKAYYQTYEDELSGDTSKMKDFHDFDQRITVLQALHAVTVNSAFSSRIEDRFGSIKEGYWADFVILAQDPFELEKQGESGLLQIANIPVVSTVVAGDAVFGFLPGTEQGNFVTMLEKSYYNNATVTAINEVEKITSQDIEDAAKGIGGVYLGHKQFEATLGAGSTDTAIFSMQIMGNNDTINNLKVTKFLNSAKTAPFEFVDGKNFVNADVNTYDGKFWVTDRHLEKVLSGDTVMEAGKAYYVHFAIQDDGNFDLDNTANQIHDPVIVTANAEPQAPTANAPAVDDSNSGCTVGTNSQYDLVVVFFAALGILAVRVFRRRENA